MPTVDDTDKYIRDYIKYKTDKINILFKQMKKLYSHIQKTEKVLNKKLEGEND